MHFKSSMAAFFALFVPLAFTLPALPQTPSDSSSVDTTAARFIDPLDSLQIRRFLTREQIIDEVLKQVIRDSTRPGLSFSRRSRALVPHPAYSDSLTGPPPMRRDPIEEELDLRAGRTPVLDFGDAARSIRSLVDRSQKKQKRPRLQDLPPLDPEELHLLTVIWEKGSATGPQIYASLDSSVRMTAEMTWRVLRRLARKGYLAEKLISPQSPFTIQTPFFSVPIEMSAKNRRNREYLYRPLVGETEILHFLVAQKYLQSRQRSGANGRSGSRLEKMIEILVRSRARRAR